jgi:hypothetical protein
MFLIFFSSSSLTVRKQLELDVVFVNEHTHPVEIYWVHGSRAHIKETLEPHSRVEHTTMISHEWYIRDARVDKRPDSPGRYRLSNDSSLGTWKIGAADGKPYKQLDDGTIEIVIEAQSCFDLSGHCPFWNGQRECTKNPVFMAEVCPLTCQKCERGTIPKDSKHDEL